MTSLDQRLQQTIIDVPDFPKPGIVFKDVTPILEDPKLMHAITADWAERLQAWKITHIAAIESRGFLFGAPLGVAMQLPLVIIRKPGKLPRPTRHIEFDLEYGSDALHIHQDALQEGDRVLIVDDLLATGGTAAAAAALVEQCGGTVAGFAFVVELAFLQGRAKLQGYAIDALHRVG